MMKRKTLLCCKDNNDGRGIVNWIWMYDQSKEWPTWQAATLDWRDGSVLYSPNTLHFDYNRTLIPRSMSYLMRPPTAYSKNKCAYST